MPAQMRAVLAFLGFLEGNRGVHVNPLNYTLLWLRDPGACGTTALCCLPVVGVPLRT